MTIDQTKPDCKFGYSIDLIQQILGDGFGSFATWFYGQTGAICDGKLYNHDTEEYEDTNCGPHGLVVYRWDFDRYVQSIIEPPTL